MYTFHIPKMSCGGCVNNIKNAIKKVDDEAVVETDLSSRTIKIETKSAEIQILTALTNAGYPVTL